MSKTVRIRLMALMVMVLGTGPIAAMVGAFCELVSGRVNFSEPVTAEITSARKATP